MFSKILLSIIIFTTQINAVLVKDLIDISGWRQNHLTGFGIVIGLDGTGDKSAETEKKLAKYLKANGTFKELSNFNSKNIASVMVTAKLEPFSRIGEKITAEVASIGNAKDLKHGLLLMTSLRGIDGKTYAICQGKLSDEKKSTAKLNSKCFIEREIKFSIKDKTSNNLVLKRPNLNLAIKIEKQINKLFGMKLAEAEDNKNILVKKPFDMSNILFLSRIHELEIEEDLLKNTNKLPIVTIDKINQSIITSDNIPLKNTVIVTRNFSLKISNSKIPELGDKEVGDGITVNIDKGMLKSNNRNSPYLGDVLKVLKILKVDFFEILNIVEKLKDQGSFEAIIEQ